MAERLSVNHVPQETHTVALHIDERTLARWAEHDLTVDRREDGTMHCRFFYEASPCRDGGRPFPSYVHAVLRREEDGWYIVDVWIEVDEEDPGWKATCIHGVYADPDARKLTAHSPARGMRVEAFLEKDWPIDHAGCYCTSTHVTHKLLLTLATVRHWLVRTGMW